MATTPYFVLSPNTILSILGLMRGPDKLVPTPAEDWRTAKVDVIIPALNEAEQIVLCLASVMRQTLRPRSIVLVDDGSSDGTVETAEAFCKLHNVELRAVRRRSPIGKTPTLKRQARELDSDVEFILDGDTVLESEDYLARTVEELYQAVGVASACGTILPLRRRDRRALMARPEIQTFVPVWPPHTVRPESRWTDIATGVTNLYREVLYSYLQRFIYKGQTVFFGSISNPVGCAVAYRRKYVEDLFDHFGPVLGDDLTNSEDIFIGMAMIDKGYRNVQLTDVYARTVEPPFYRLPRQVYLWSSAFLQSCYYFDPLVKSPLKAVRRALPRGGQAPSAAASAANAAASASPAGDEAQPTGPERRRIAEPYRQAFGRERTARDGRPAGWMVLMSAMEKVFFPTTLLILIVLRYWEALAVTLAAETAVGLACLVVVMKGQRLEFLGKGLLVAPIRYVMLLSELFTIGIFAVDLWVRKDRRWRK
jgi:glycosyltransferase involved in cell wall biosynthesis